MPPMLRMQVFTTDEPAWRDAGRRLRQSTFVAFGDVAMSPQLHADAQAVVLADAAQVEAAFIEKALSAGRHVLVAAEPCLTAVDLKKLAAVAESHRVRLDVVNPDRFLPSRQTIYQQLGGPLGSPELVRVHFWQAHDAADSTSPLGLPGPLVGELEQAAWFYGRLPRRVFALEQGAAAGDSAVGRYLQLHLAFEPGMALIDYNDRLPSRAGEPNVGYRSLSVIGSSGSAQVDDQANMQLRFSGGAPRGVSTTEGVRHLAALVDDFATAVTEGRKSSMVSNWLDVAAVVDAVRRALQTRDAVAMEARP